MLVDGREFGSLSDVALEQVAELTTILLCKYVSQSSEDGPLVLRSCSCPAVPLELDRRTMLTQSPKVDLLAFSTKS